MVINAMLLYGIVKNRKRFFYPYFGHTSVTILCATAVVIYFLCLPEERINAFFVFGFVFAEVQFLYATVSYYKLQLSQNHLIQVQSDKIDNAVNC